MTAADPAALDDRVREWRVRPSDVDDLVRTWARQALVGQPLVWVIAVAAAFMIIGGAGSGSTQLLGFGILFVAVETLSVSLSLRRSSKNLRASYQPGTVVTTAFGYAGFTVTTARGLVRYDYGSFRRVAERGDWVYLLNRNARSWAILPRSIFPPEAIARVRNAVRANR